MVMMLVRIHVASASKRMAVIGSRRFEGGERVTHHVGASAISFRLVEGARGLVRDWLK
jgi:hypothetical protein